METYLGWGEVEPELFGRFLSREEPLPPVMLGAMAHRWEVLRQENAPLRAVVNGRVRSVGEDFYDEMIRRHLPEGQTKIANHHWRGSRPGEAGHRRRLAGGAHPADALHRGAADAPGGPGAVLPLCGRKDLTFPGKSVK